MTDDPCTVEDISGMTFEPMRLESVLSAADFRERASGAFTTLALAGRLLKLGPAEMAEFLMLTFPDDPTELVEICHHNRKWLEGLAAVLGCVEARALIALSQRAVGS